MLKDYKFWGAVYFLIQTLVFHFYPDFSLDIWKAIDGIIVVILGGLTVRDARS